MVLFPLYLFFLLFFELLLLLLLPLQILTNTHPIHIPLIITETQILPLLILHTLFVLQFHLQISLRQAITPLIHQLLKLPLCLIEMQIVLFIPYHHLLVFVEVLHVFYVLEVFGCFEDLCEVDFVGEELGFGFF